MEEGKALYHNHKVYTSVSLLQILLLSFLWGAQPSNGGVGTAWTFISLTRKITNLSSFTSQLPSWTSLLNFKLFLLLVDYFFCQSCTFFYFLWMWLFHEHFVMILLSAALLLSFTLFALFCFPIDRRNRVYRCWLVRRGVCWIRWEGRMPCHDL